MTVILSRSQTSNFPAQRVPANELHPTEIDVRATLHDKLGKDMEDYLILGACNPPLAHRALETDRRIGLLLPCNVVVRRRRQTVVEALNPQVMVGVSGQAALEPVAEEATRRLAAALDTLGS